MRHHLLCSVVLALTTVTGCASKSGIDDDDSDGFDNSIDNCPLVSNSDQADVNGNGVGDVCDFCEVMSLAADIWPGTDSSGLRHLTLVGNKLYFQGNDGVHGDELWVYDPVEGPSLVEDIVRGSGDSRPDGLTALDGKLYFWAQHNELGRTLWSYDPSTPTAGVALAADINIASSSDPITLDGKLFFEGKKDDYDYDYELWMYDPAVGVMRIADLRPGNHGSALGQLTVFDGKLFFSANEGNGNELWFYDQITNDLEKVSINSFSDNAGSYPHGLTVMDGKLYFSANDGVHGHELWVYDAAAGASLVVDINSGGEPSYPDALITLDGKLYFMADDGISGRELWVYDPIAGAMLVADIYPGERSSFLRSWQFIALGGKLFFIGYDDIYGEELRVYDPAGGVTLVADFVPGVGGFGDDDPEPPTNFRIFDGVLYFNAYDGVSDYALWKYDAIAGPIKVDEFWPDTGITRPPYITIGLNDKLYFSADDGIHGNELWVYDRACS